MQETTDHLIQCPHCLKEFLDPSVEETWNQSWPPPLPAGVFQDDNGEFIDILRHRPWKAEWEQDNAA